MSSATYCEELEFTWKIENFTMFIEPVKLLRSPMLSIGNPRHSIFYLNIYPGGWDETSKNIVAVDLIRIEGSFKGKLLFRMSVVACDDDSTVIISYDPSENVYVPRLNLSPEKDAYRAILFPLDLMDRFLSNDTLTIRCKLRIENIPRHFVDDLITMSKTIYSLYESKAYSDLTLYTSEGEFKVHKFIMKQRAPDFFNDLGLEIDNSKHECKKVDGISTPVLQSLIQYMYNGYLEDILQTNIPEFLEMTHRYGINTENFFELTLGIINLGISSTICTKMKVLSKEVYWDFNDKSNTVGEVQSICFGPIEFSVKPQLNVICADITFKCHSKLEKALFVCCKMHLGNKDVPNWTSIKYQTLLFDVGMEESEQHLPSPHLQKYTNESGLRLQLLVSVSDFDKTETVDNLMIVDPERPSQFGFCALFYDLIFLFNKAQWEKCSDVTFVFDSQHKIWAHKAILSAWSPVFEDMFKSEVAGKNVVTKVSLDAEDIPHIDTETTLRLIRFFYGGIAVQLSFEEDVKLYLISDEYKISSLFARCSSFLEYHLVLSNVYDILMLAYAYSDDLLLASARKYFCANQEAVTSSKEWKLLSDSYPYFSSMLQEPIDC